jgi:anthranilate phosphoribosyltransferase
MSVLPELAALLSECKDLSDEQVGSAVQELLSSTVSSKEKADFLAALSRKGEKVSEIAAFVAALRQHSHQVPLDPRFRNKPILDVCGTGGDHSNTFNISTTVAILCAAAGIQVAKHGNRAITSRSGSYDVLKELKIPTELDSKAAAHFFAEHNFVFLAAPRFHPAFREVAEARKLCAEQGKRTIFNLIGPLMNPARPSVQLVGVPMRNLCKPIANVLEKLGLQSGMVVCGLTGYGFLDEVSTIGRTFAVRLGSNSNLSHLKKLSVVWWLMGVARNGAASHGNSLREISLRPRDFNLPQSRLKDLRGGSAAENAEIIRRILTGKERGPKLDAVLANAAIAFCLVDKTKTYLQGVKESLKIIESGEAENKLNALAA